MKRLLLAVLFFAAQAVPQTAFQDILLNNSAYSRAPQEVQARKAFMRERHFYEQRAYPNESIEPGAYAKAIAQRNDMRAESVEKLPVTWSSIGPKPGYYSQWGNISSRILTGCYDYTNPNIIYIGAANGGIWKSTDGGATFFPKSDNEVSLSSGALAMDPVNPQILYYGTGEATYSGSSYYGAGLLKSTNGGDTWLSIRSGLPSSSYFSRIVIHPLQRNTLLAAMGNGGLYRSTDAGMNWTQIIAVRCDDVVYSFTGDTAYCVGGTIGVQRSVDGGATFAAWGSGFGTATRIHFDYCKAQPAVWYSAVHASSAVKVYKSTNYGSTWTQISTSTDFRGSQAWYDLYCRVHPNNPNIAYVGTIELFRTMDGSNFTNISLGYSGGSVHVDQHYLFFHPSQPSTFIACNDGGIYRSTDNGDSFSNLNESLTLTQFYRIAASPFNSSLVMGGTQDNGTQRTTGTMNWAMAFGGDGGEVSFNPFNSNYIIGESQNNGMVRTTNGGTSWSNATSGIASGETPAWVAPIQHHPSISGTYYTARQRVYKSTDNGASWNAISGNVNGTSAVRELAISKVNPDLMYASSSRYVYRSTDGGATWTAVTTGLQNRTVTSVYAHPANQQVAFVTQSGFGGAKVFRTTNQGANWTSIMGNLIDSPVNDIFVYPPDPDNTYFAATDVGVFLTRNGGATWTEVTDGLPNTVILHLDYSPSTKKLRAGTHGRGVYEAVIDFSTGGTTASFATNAGWNLISVPLTAANMLTTSLFPQASTPAYTYDPAAGYKIVDTLKTGSAYWLRFPSAQNHNITGAPVNPLSIPLRAGWNLIGGIIYPVPVSLVQTIPSGILQSPFYGYLSNYVSADTIKPGMGYWIKSSTTGTMTIGLPTGSASQPRDAIRRRD